MDKFKAFLNKNKFIIFMLLILLIFTIAPYIIAIVNTPDNTIFTGFLYNSMDIQTYISKMNNGIIGFEFINNYTNVNNNGGYLFIFYILLGRIANILSISNELMYHISRVILSILFLLSLNSLTNKLNISNIKKKIIIILCLFGSNFQFFIDFIKSYSGLNIDNSAMFVDMFPSMAILFIPHFILTMICQVEIIKELLIYEENEIKSSFKISIILFIISLIHPYTAVLCGVIAGLYIIIEKIIKGTFNIKSLFKISIFSIFSLPYLIYCLYILNKVDMLILWREQSITLMPSLLDMLLSTGIVYITSYILIFIPNNWIIKERRVFSLYIIITILVANLKTNTQIRFLEGLAIYIFILIGLILGDLIEKNKLKITAYVLIALLTINSFYMIFEVLLINRADGIMYISLEQQEVYNFIEVNTEEDSVFLSDLEISNYIPSKTLRRVVFGHNAESINYSKWDKLNQYIKDTGDIDVLKDEDVDYFILNKEYKNKEINSKIVFDNLKYEIYSKLDKKAPSL